MAQALTTSHVDASARGQRREAAMAALQARYAALPVGQQVDMLHLMARG